MALGINTNVASINAQNQLSKSQGQNDQALERLSSGLRINSAKDDAAGLAISTRFESQISGQQVASRNSQDGISLAQTAEGALDEITNNLQRVRELSVQAANATNSASDREALNDEVQQRIEEIDRIASQTDFNGLNVLDGSLETQDFQVGANVGETIGVDLSQGSRADQIGSIASDSLQVEDEIGGAGQSLSIRVGDDGDFVSISDSGDFVVEDDQGNVVSGFESDSAFAVGAAIEDAEVPGLNVQVDNEQTLTAFDDGADEDTLTINGVQVFEQDGANADLDDVVSGINAASGSTGVRAENVEGDLALTAQDGRNINIEGADDFSLEEDGTALTADETLQGQVSFSAGEDVNLESDANLDELFSSESASTNLDGTAGQVGVNEDEALQDSDISSVEGANDAILRVDSALDTVNQTRSELGAIQNRFESTIANLDNNIENLSEANSRIRDADFAAESANLSQSQVLQQAGISVLAQANARPQQVLSLLQ